MILVRNRVEEFGEKLPRYFGTALGAYQVGGEDNRSTTIIQSTGLRMDREPVTDYLER